MFLRVFFFFFLGREQNKKRQKNVHSLLRAVRNCHSTGHTIGWTQTKILTQSKTRSQLDLTEHIAIRTMQLSLNNRTDDAPLQQTLQGSHSPKNIPNLQVPYCWNTSHYIIALHNHSTLSWKLPKNKTGSIGSLYNPHTTGIVNIVKLS